MNGIFDRVELLLGSETLQQIQSRRIIVFGMGGVGSWCAESLVRSGVNHLTIVDCDVVATSNINRQLMATTETIGQPKVEAMRQRLLSINPDADINAVQEVYTSETDALFHLEDYDYIVDCIDTLKNKMALLMNATTHKALVFSSMGAALKIDPTQIRVKEFWKVRGCPLGAALRKKMKQQGIKLSQKVTCVYSEELMTNARQNNTRETVGGSTKAQTNGSLHHITSIFGITIAGLIIKDITSQPQ